MESSVLVTSEVEQMHTRLMAATSSEGPTSSEVPLSAMALQPPLQESEAPGTFTLSISICQYPRRVTGALHQPPRDDVLLSELA